MIRALEKKIQWNEERNKTKEKSEGNGLSEGRLPRRRQLRSERWREKKGDSDLSRSRRVHLYGAMRSELLLLHLHLPYHGLVECAGR